MDLSSSRLYKHLLNNRRYENFYRDTFDIYFYINGFDKALINDTQTINENEKWVYDFLIFAREYLNQNFELENIPLWYNHIGEIIFKIEPDSKKGIDLFYKILDLFVKRQ